MRLQLVLGVDSSVLVFPRLRAGTFIEAAAGLARQLRGINFPAFGRGLSLRLISPPPGADQITISPPSGGDFH